MPNPEDITDPTTAMNMALALMAKAFKLNYSTPTNNNQRISSNPRNRQIAQPGNLNGYNDVQNVRNQVIQNAVQNERIQNVGNQNGLIVIPGNANQNPNRNGNLVAARAEGNETKHNGNQIRGYNYRGLGHFARNCTVRPKTRDAAYLQTQLLIAQKEEAGIQLQAEEFDLMATVADLDEIEEVTADYILMANMQQASTSGTQTDKALVSDSDGSAEVHNDEYCYDNEIFNMFTQEEQYTELLESIPEPHQVAQNDNNVISEVSSVEQKAAKFVGDFKSLAKEADESLAKHKTLELEIEHLLRAVVSRDIITVVQNNSLNETSNLQTELERTKERFENYIIKKENEYAKFGMIGVDNTKTRRPQSRRNTKNDRVPSMSKSSYSKNKEANNVNSKVVCAMCKQCLNSVNHDVCLLNYVNDMNSHGKKQKANVSINENQKKQKPKVKKTKKVGSIKRLASPKPSKPRSFLRWLPSGRLFDLKGKIIASSESESQSDYSKGDNACTSNHLEPTIKWFPNFTFSLAVEAARTILIFSRAPLFLWAEAIATVCFTQNRSIFHRRFNKTPYELINGRKPDISFLHVFGALCYPKNDNEDIGKLGTKGDIGFFIGYSVDSCAFRVYNRRTKKIMETMNVTFDELSIMAFEQRSSKPGIQSMIFGQINTAPTPTNSFSQATNFLNSSQDVDGLNSQQQHAQQKGNQAPIQPETVADNVLNAMFDVNTFVNPFATPSTSTAESPSSQYVDPSNMHTFY
nr:retrovirus-related Pol polyprotein from transposon TNT 1-94 [Tanacetum cinerariifolium]